jgi:hypothetical protein
MFGVQCRVAEKHTALIVNLSKYNRALAWSESKVYSLANLTIFWVWLDFILKPL